MSKIPKYVIERATKAVSERSEDVWEMVERHNKYADKVNLGANKIYRQKETFEVI